jgi:hypothetical protein
MTPWQVVGYVWIASVFLVALIAGIEWLVALSRCRVVARWEPVRSAPMSFEEGVTLPARNRHESRGLDGDRHAQSTSEPHAAVATAVWRGVRGTGYGELKPPPVHSATGSTPVGSHSNVVSFPRHETVDEQWTRLQLEAAALSPYGHGDQRESR